MSEDRQDTGNEHEQAFQVARVRAGMGWRVDMLPDDFKWIEEQLAAKDARIAEMDQQVKNLEEYVLKGVTFRDELQARIKELEARECRMREAGELALLEWSEWVSREFMDEELLPAELKRIADCKAALSSSSPCSHKGEADALREELRNIAEAKRFKRDYFRDDTEFADWAQSRCRGAVSAHVAGEGEKGP